MTATSSSPARSTGATAATTAAPPWSRASRPPTSWATTHLRLQRDRPRPQPGRLRGCLRLPHGRPAPTPAFEHCDGDARTYNRAPSGRPTRATTCRATACDDYMNIPKWNDYGTTQYNLCFNCHDAVGALRRPAASSSTNFRNDRRHLWNNRWSNNLHYAAPDCTPPPGLGSGPAVGQRLGRQQHRGWRRLDRLLPGLPQRPRLGLPEDDPARRAGLDAPGPQAELVLRLRPGHPDRHRRRRACLDSRWGTSDVITGFTSNHVCTGCHGTGSESYFRYPHEVLVPVPGSPAPQPLVNALVWTSDTADNAADAVHSQQPAARPRRLLRLPVLHAAALRRLPAAAHPALGLIIRQDDNKAPLQVESAYAFYWDMTVPVRRPPRGIPRSSVLIDGTDRRDALQQTARRSPSR